MYNHVLCVCPQRNNGTTDANKRKGVGLARSYFILWPNLFEGQERKVKNDTVAHDNNHNNYYNIDHIIFK